MRSSKRKRYNLLPDEYVLADDSALFIRHSDQFGVTTMREFKAHQLRGDDKLISMYYNNCQLVHRVRLICWQILW